MGLRDIVLFAIVFVGLPFIVRRPALGILFWAWISLMNPHREAWGLAYSFPFAQVVALATLIGIFVSREPKSFKGGAAAIVLVVFVFWMATTTIFALAPERALPMLERVLKIQLFTLLGLLLLHSREHVRWLILVLALSIGFYGVKGGAFTIATAGSYRVWGPAESFISDNNALALAVVMSIPMWAYLFVMHKQIWVRLAIGMAIFLSAASAFGSHSRGALIAIIAMSLFLWFKGRRKLLLGTALGVTAATLVAFMPAQWEDRMRTIGEYQQDDSAQGRLNTWQMLFNLALDRPLVGGGFEPYSREIFQRYLPEYNDVHSAHSVYFQVLGEHGFVGIALFLLFWWLVWRTGSRIIRATDGKPDQEWAFWLARMVQVSLVGYLVGGTFLNLAYWDMPYYLMVVLAVTWRLVDPRRATAVTTSQSAPSDSRATAQARRAGP